LSSDKILDIHKLGHPRNGKIANLPKEQRDDLNQMLTDGAMPHRRGGSFQTFPVPFPQGDIKVNKGKSR
jgi:hypothetical protein